MKKIISGICYNKFNYDFVNSKKQIVHLIEFEQNVNKDLTLLISKVSEAILPYDKENHIGEGANLDNFLQKQKGVRFIINGGFSHYKKDFYKWSHQNFNVGDPVGVVKVRQHFYQDFLDTHHYGFFVQNKKGENWQIIKEVDLSYNEKYILGCTPLLIYKGKICDLPEEINKPVEKGQINPPSYLGHGLESHPRTAIGLKNNKIYFVNVDSSYGGCSLLELQQLGVFLELECFLNLDGGGSSQFKLFTDQEMINNEVEVQDRERILGHVLVIFDENLKK